MQFVRLGPEGNEDYIPDKLIEGYNSLIFTERYREYGDFEFKTYDIDRMLDLLPEDTLVSHLQTNEVMRVDTHEINTDINGISELTITGVSIDEFLKRRYIEAPYQKKRSMRRKYSSTGAAGVLLFNSVDNPSGNDVTRGDNEAWVNPGQPAPVAQNDYSWTTKDVIPNVSVTDSVRSESDPKSWFVTEGDLYSQLIAILEGDELGIRGIRPHPGGSGTVIKVVTQLAGRGDIERVSNPSINALQFNIYQGYDRTKSVVLSQRQGHLLNPKSLYSSRDYRNGIEIQSGVSVSDVYLPGESNRSGWDRRTTQYDAGTPEFPPEPQKPEELRKNATKQDKEKRKDDMDEYLDKHARWKNKCDRIMDDFQDDAKKKALRALKQQKRLRVVTSDLAPGVPYRFKRDYDLGDLITLNADYGRKEIMMVNEYIRTEDSTGESGFPGLITP